MSLRPRLARWGRSAVAPARVLSRLIARRPWLSGTAALLVVVLCAFAGFGLARWDDVDVGDPQALLDVEILNQRTAPADTPRLEPADRPPSAAASQPAATGVVRTASVLEPAYRLLPAERGPAMLTPHPLSSPPDVAHDAEFADVRGAWLTGTIEETPGYHRLQSAHNEDDGPFRRQ
ncbi:MAG: hypothetical protein KY476_04670 [Planctomycetes bacterium]|nr:hypothetical protein [Planctomycetota bacterium]